MTSSSDTRYRFSIDRLLGERNRLVKDTEKTAETIDVSHGTNAKKICKKMSRSLAIGKRIFREASGMIENL